MLVVALAAAPVGLTGCGAAQLTAEMKALTVRIDANEQARLEVARKLEELDNRLFLLADQLESSKVAMAQRGGNPFGESSPSGGPSIERGTPSLPVVTLRPPEEPAVAESPGSPHDPAVGSLAVGSLVDGTREPLINAKRDGVPIGREEAASAKGSKPGLDRGASTGQEGETTSGQPVGPGLGTAVSGRRRVLHLDREGAGRVARPPSLPLLHAQSPLPQRSDSSVPSLGVSRVPSLGEVNGDVPLPDVGAAPPSEPLTLYREAYQLLRSGELKEAATRFRDFVRRFPRHDYADNAQYWLGEALYAGKDYSAAAPEFQSVVVRWPSGNKAPDALLKLGYCHLKSGDVPKAREVLKKLTGHYPRTDAAHLAERRLEELRGAKRVEEK